MNQEEFFADRGPADPVVAGRYRLPDPETGEQRSWTRASNYGYPIADQYGLTRWRHRQIIRGLRARTDLQQLVTVLDPDDVGKVDEVLSTALEVAGSTEDANRGTAIHEALALADRGQEYPEWARPYVEGYRAELARHGLEVVLVERLLINRDRGSAGRTDRVYRTADGRFVVGDIKSSGHLDLQAGEIAVQVENYSGATHMQADDGTFRPLDAPIDRDEAVIVHVDRDTGACAVYRLVMPLARYGANLAQQVREWHRMTRNLLLPYVRPVGDVAPQLARSLQAVPAIPVPEPDRAGASALDENQRHLQSVPDPGTHAVSAGLVDDPGNEHSANSTTATLGEALETAAAGLKTADELMKLDKPKLQQYGRERGVTDLAHNRKVLVEIFTRAGIVAGASASSAATRPGGDPAVLPPGPATTGAEDPTDPRTDAFRRARLAEIAAAPSVAELYRIHQTVIRLGGDQAWTDEMTEAARERTAELDAQDAHPGEGQSMSQTVLDKILACQSSQDLAQLWEEVTVGGSAPERWTDEVQRAAAERMAQIKAATPPPPSNPFAGS